MKAIIMLLFSAGIASGQTNDAHFDVLRTLDGRSFKNATITRTTAAYAVVDFDGGGANVAFTNLPPDLQTRYHYDPAAAEQFWADLASKKRLSHQQEQKIVASMVKAMQTLGEPKRVRLVRVMPNTYLEIESDGVRSEAYIPTLPADVLPLLREFTAAQADFDALIGQDSSGSVPIRGSAFRETRSQARNEVGNARASVYAQAATQQARADASRRLEAARSAFKPRNFITARPSAYMPYVNVRQWEFEAMAAPTAP
jgi:hypothetical protein